jgi:hypothetical protein
LGWYYHTYAPTIHTTVSIDLSLLFVAVSSAFAQATKPIKVLILVADDLGCADVSFQGCKDIPILG